MQGFSVFAVPLNTPRPKDFPLPRCSRGKKQGAGGLPPHPAPFSLLTRISVASTPGSHSIAGVRLAKLWPIVQLIFSVGFVCRGKEAHHRAIKETFVIPDAPASVCIYSQPHFPSTLSRGVSILVYKETLFRILFAP
jgi:hypothetical protein